MKLMNMSNAPYKVCLAITGASGFRYALRLLEQLLHATVEVHCVISDGALEVARLEEDLLIPSVPEQTRDVLLSLVNASADASLYCYSTRDWQSPIASGSYPMDAMVVCPCSTGSLASIAMGLSDDLIKRGAVVALKEHRRLVLVPRETPVSAIQVEHMHKLALMGVRIVPASPGFYHKPSSIDDLVDFLVARILSQLDVPQSLLTPWSEGV